MAQILEQATKDAAMKERIVAHMNHDHQDSLVRYLEYFGGVSSFSARKACLLDITFSSLTITSSGKKYHIQIKPPATTWSDVRPRVVAMDTEALSRLGRSKITIKIYARPYGFMLIVFIACVLTLINFSRRTNFEPGSLLYDSILGYAPRFAAFCWTIQPLVIYPMILLHTGEAIYMARSRLARHNVPVVSRLWLVWICSAFIEGYGSFVRFDALVTAEEARRASRKH